ncbi:unnamed protein product [Mytilus coruscus]|uniref:Fibronectin type-III domain-containing protein n=1 Tax=Mytilus coruscus TaxID=42192 RepID=A0A6J8E6S8_MYTCO|nr:unnamed protein product [Mytilus coruscus]
MGIYWAGNTYPGRRYELQHKNGNEADPINRYSNALIWKEAGNVDCTTYKFSVKDLKKGQDYYFKDTAINSKGSGYPLESIDLVKLFVKPSAPEGPMSISDITDSSVVVEWKAPNTDGGAPVEKYKIEYELANTSRWIVAGNVDSTTYKFMVKDLKKGQDYYFKVTACNSKGPGSPLESTDLVKLIGRFHGINTTS